MPHQSDPSDRRTGSKTGPAVVALLSLSACGAQGATPRVDIAPVALVQVVPLTLAEYPAPQSP